MGLLTLDPTQKLSMKECSLRLDIVMKIYNRFSTKELETVLRELYLKRSVRELVVTPGACEKRKKKMPDGIKRKYEKKIVVNHHVDVTENHLADEVSEDIQIVTTSSPTVHFSK